MNTTARSHLDAALQRLVQLLQQGDSAEAEAYAAEARREFPVASELVRLHGIALLQLGRRREALVALNRAGELAPDSVEVQCNLASLALEDDNPDAAIERLRATLRRAPGHPAVLYGLGNALMAAARYTQAREAFAMATHGAPEHPGLRLNLAAAELELGNPAQAHAHVQEALQLAPSLGAAHALLGHVLQAQGQAEQAASAYLQAEQLAPQHPHHAFQAGLMLDSSNQLDAAAQAYARAVRVAPDNGAALSQLIFTKRRLCDWHDLDALSEQLHRAVATERHDVTPFAFLAEQSDVAEQRRCASTFAAGIEKRMAPLRRQLELAPVTVAPDAPTRVGFVADGFGEHATGLLVVALFEALAEHADLDIHLFATAPSDQGPIRRRLEACVQVHDLSAMTHAQAATAIHAAAIEVLFDLTGYCGRTSADLFALRPAPVQVNWLAYPGTAGAPWMDYILADAVVLPAEHREGYSERVLRLPRCFQPNDPTRTLAEPPSREACGLPADGVVFASFNSSYKINPAAFARFMVILRQVPDSVLWLLSGPEGADDRLRKAAAALDIAPERLVFMPRLPHADYLARYAHVDLFLDTLPYNAHTTASDALWAGCPLLTCSGPTFAGRVAASLLQHLGLPELVTEDEEAFIAMATELGGDRAALGTLRTHLQQQREHSPLFDMRGFAADFRRIALAIGARHRIGRPPTDLDF